MTEVPAASRLRHPFPTGSPPTLNLVPWPDAALDAHGHRPGSPYVLATGSKWIFELPECCLQKGGGIGG